MIKVNYFACQFYNNNCSWPQLLIEKIDKNCDRVVSILSFLIKGVSLDTESPFYELFYFQYGIFLCKYKFNRTLI